VRASRWLLAALALLGVLWLWSSARSPKERIRSLLRSMADGFDRGDLRRAMAGIAPGWREEESGADRDRLRQALMHFFLTEGRAAEGGQRPFRLELDPQLLVELDLEREKTAVARGEARLLEQRGEEERVRWAFAFECALEEREGSWRILSTRTRSLAGRRPRRGTMQRCRPPLERVPARA
jgi:hypothetical protein